MSSRLHDGIARKTVQEMAWQEFIEWMRFNHLPTSEEATTGGQKKLNATEVFFTEICDMPPPVVQ